MSSDPTSILAYKNIIKTSYNLLGWFTGIVDVKVKIRNKAGFIPMYFYRGISYRFKNMHDFEDCFFAEKEDLELDIFMKTNISILCH